MVKQLFLVWSFIYIGALSAQESTYPVTDKPSCAAMKPEVSTSEGYKKGSELAKKALTQKWTSPEGVWHQETIARRKNIGKALEEYEKGLRGASVATLDLRDKSPEQIHTFLLKAGFHHDRRPLVAGSEGEERLYWKMDGTKTANRNDPNLMPIDIYVHADGGVVRVKPMGVPDVKFPTPPEYAKAVLLTLTPKYSHRTRKKELDTTYRNEAFKVNTMGMAIPKGPSLGGGIKLLHRPQDVKNAPNRVDLIQEQKGWIDTIMNEGHVPLPADFSHCSKERKAA